MLSPVSAVELDLQAVDALPPDEQHRQLSLMLLVSAGVDESLMAIIEQRLSPVTSPSDDEVVGQAPGESRTFDAERYTSPLARIVALGPQ